MTAPLEHPQTGSPGHGYAEVAPRHTLRTLSAARRSAADAGPAVIVAEAGFPRAAAPVRPWIPGVSTPEGIILASAAMVAASETFGPAGEMVVRAVQGTAATVLASTIVSIPAAALWLGERLLQR